MYLYVLMWECDGFEREIDLSVYTTSYCNNYDALGALLLLTAQCDKVLIYVAYVVYETSSINRAGCID